MIKRPGSYLVLLLALGAQTLVVELTIPRLIAPVFGNTLFCWTAIIAVVLFALTIGYRLGGRYAKALGSAKWIVGISAAAACWVIMLAIFGQGLVGKLDFLELMFGPLVATLLLAAAPAFLGALVVPFVIELSPESPGDAAGKCFAWSTIGSILGVMLTGYLLLPLLGISGALLVAAALVFLALPLTGRPGAFVGVTGIILCVMVYTLGSSESRYLVDISNGYHRVRILEWGDDNRYRSMYLDSELQGIVEVGSVEPVATYHKAFSDLLPEFMPFERVIHLGGGTFSIASEMNYRYPEARIEVAEIDPDIVAVGREYLGLRDEVIVHVGDARQVLKRQHEKYDIIVNDAFRGFMRIPFHMTSLEFAREVSDKLSAGGIYAVNVRGTPADSHITGSMVKTLQLVFRHIRLVPVNDGNTWLIASQAEQSIGIEPVTNREFGMVLTDNHAPIETIMLRDLVHSKIRSD